MQYIRALDNKIVTLRLSKKGIDLKPLVSVGEAIQEGQLIASVVPITQKITCSGRYPRKEYVGRLESPSIAERYAAAKALSYLDPSLALTPLQNKVNDVRDHIYVRLEAAASLLRMSDNPGLEFLKDTTNDEYLENRLEAVIILGEIDTEASRRLLSDVLLDRNQHPDIRAGAAWSLGEIGQPETLDTLVGAFVGVEETVRVEAARALAKLAEAHSQRIIERFPQFGQEERPGIAWALGKKGRFSVDDLAKCLVDDDARQWVAYIIGTQREEDYITQIENLSRKDPEVYFAVTVLWKIVSSWIYGLEEY